MRRRHVLLATLALVLLGAVALSAQSVPAVHNADGSITRLVQGRYGELFPGGGAATPGSSVLALEVIRAGTVAERRLVPGTEGADHERLARHFQDVSGDSLYLVWEALDTIHSQLYAISFDGHRFGTLIEIASNPFSFKENLQLALTRQRARGTGGEASELRVLHLSWWEEGGGDVFKRYAAIGFAGGGASTTVAELDLELLSSPPALGAWSWRVPGLEHSLRLQPGLRSASVLVGFVDSWSGRLRTFELELPPTELLALADRARMQVPYFGARARSYVELAANLKAELLAAGAESFHPASLAYLASALHDDIAALEGPIDSGALTSLAERARMQVFYVGSRMERGGLQGSGPVNVLELNPEDPNSLLLVAELSSRAAPQVNGPAQLFLSASGSDVLVAWEEAGAAHVFYQESDGAGWRPVQAILPSGDLSRAEVYDLLAERMLNR